MKTTIKNIKKSILMVAMIATWVSYANEPTSFIIKKDHEGTSLIFENLKEGELLSIKDDSGLTLYKEKIKKVGNYSKEFDLTALLDGDYFFEIERDLEIKTIPFSVHSNKVTFFKEKETTIHKPYAILKKNHIYVSKLALNEEPLEVNIFYVNSYGGSGLIHSETITGTKNIEKIYKLMKPATGNFILVLNSDNRVYYQYFVL